jgi:adenosine deaminase
VIPHLHLHLEPEERQRTRLGLTRRNFRSKEQFFDAHRLEQDDRVEVAGTDLRAFLTEVHAEQRAAGVDHVELRLSPRRFISGGMTWDEVLGVADAALAGLSAPTVRVVLLINRDSQPAHIDACQRVVERGLPPTFVGIDLAGDEQRFPDTGRFRSLFQAARAHGLGITVHAGEFGGADHIWRALDDLGALRIGHGLAAGSSASLMKRLAEDGILLETSLSSNLALGAVSSLREHPARLFLERGIPVCFNADVPLHTGRSFQDELALAAELLGSRQQDLLTLQARAARFRFPDRGGG